MSDDYKRDENKPERLFTDSGMPVFRGRIIRKVVPRIAPSGSCIIPGGIDQETILERISEENSLYRPGSSRVYRALTGEPPPSEATALLATVYVLLEKHLDYNAQEALARAGLEHTSEGGTLKQVREIIMATSPEVIRAMLVPILRRYELGAGQRSKEEQDAIQAYRLLVKTAKSAEEFPDGTSDPEDLRRLGLGIEASLGNIAFAAVGTLGSKEYVGIIEPEIQGIYRATEIFRGTINQLRKDLAESRYELEARGKERKGKSLLRVIKRALRFKQTPAPVKSLEEVVDELAETRGLEDDLVIGVRQARKGFHRLGRQHVALRKTHENYQKQAEGEIAALKEELKETKLQMIEFAADVTLRTQAALTAERARGEELSMAVDTLMSERDYAQRLVEDHRQQAEAGDVYDLLVDGKIGIEGDGMLESNPDSMQEEKPLGINFHPPNAMVDYITGA